MVCRGARERVNEAVMARCERRARRTTSAWDQPPPRTLEPSKSRSFPVTTPTLRASCLVLLLCSLRRRTGDVAAASFDLYTAPTFSDAFIARISYRCALCIAWISPLLPLLRSSSLSCFLSFSLTVKSALLPYRSAFLSSVE